MKKLIVLFIILLIGFMSCTDNKPKANSIEIEDISQEQIDSILRNFNFEYQNPIVLDSGRHILIPISTEFLKEKKRFSGSGYYEKDFPRYWNVLFFNNQTGETKLLTQEKYRISTIAAEKEEHNYNREVRTLEGYILYEITTIDYNKDEKINHLDPDYLFISNIDGRNLLRLSPEYEKLIYYKVIPNSKQIIFETRRDTNQDSLFTGKDELVWYQTELIDNQWQMKELIDSTQRKNIENLYFEQWLKKN